MAAARMVSATAVLALYGLLYLLIALLPDTGLSTFFGSLAAIYGLAVVGLAAGWFWARWFARGVGMWGLVAGVMLMVLGGVATVLVFFSVTHAAVMLLLAGDRVVARYDGRDDWRERYQLDEVGAKRIADLVTNLGSLLPWVAFYALFPRQVATPAFAALLLTTLGLVGVLRNRTWGILAILAGGAALFGSTLCSMVTAGVSDRGALFVGALLLVTALPIVPAMFRFLRRP